ncbi:hypothetical protein OG873_32445 [Streptomyces violaceus]|uniref:Uncharacterized protein n=1 Tax=Streptomyces violaceus TaxID=1936 RepID=A0ABZ1P0R2_STRVL
MPDPVEGLGHLRVGVQVRLGRQSGQLGRDGGTQPPRRGALHEPGQVEVPYARLGFPLRQVVQQGQHKSAGQLRRPLLVRVVGDPGLLFQDGQEAGVGGGGSGPEVHTDAPCPRPAGVVALAW